jgi:hypothetical protein
MKKLERAAAPADATPQPSIWGVGHSLMLSGIVLLLCVAGLWILVLKFGTGDPYEQLPPEELQTHFQKMSPLQTWQRWAYFQEVGINPQKQRPERDVESQYAQRQMHLIYLSIAAAGGTALLVAGIILIRRRQTKAVLNA